MARCFADLGALAAVVDHSPDKAAALAARYGCRVLDFEGVLADPSIDAVAIATQPIWHGALTRAALAAGKHVFVEKPLTLDIGEAETLAAAAEASGRILMVGHLLQYHAAFTALRDLVAQGELGRLRRIVATRLNLGAIRQNEDALWCLAPHDVSMVLALAGEMPETVAASADRLLRPSVADAAWLRLGFPSAAAATIHVSWLHPVKEQRLVVVGSAAMAVFDDVAPWPDKLTLYRHGVAADGRVERAAPEPVAVVPAEPLLAQCRHFLNCIASGRAPRTGSAEALRVMAVLDRAARATAIPEPKSVS